MAIAQFIEGTAFGVFNDILSAFHNNEGYALPNRYEVVITPPSKNGGGQQENIFANKENTSRNSGLLWRIISDHFAGIKNLNIICEPICENHSSLLHA